VASSIWNVRFDPSVFMHGVLTVLGAERDSSFLSQRQVLHHYSIHPRHVHTTPRRAERSKCLAPGSLLRGGRKGSSPCAQAERSKWLVPRSLAGGGRRTNRFRTRILASRYAMGQPSGNQLRWAHSQVLTPFHVCIYHPRPPSLQPLTPSPRGAA